VLKISCSVLVLSHAFKLSFLDLPCITDFFIWCISGKKDASSFFTVDTIVKFRTILGLNMQKWKPTSLYLRHLKVLEFIQVSDNPWFEHAKMETYFSLFKTFESVGIHSRMPAFAICWERVMDSVLLKALLCVNLLKLTTTALFFTRESVDSNCLGSSSKEREYLRLLLGWGGQRGYLLWALQLHWDNGG
jgi:hypothetical protein